MCMRGIRWRPIYTAWQLMHPQIKLYAQSSLDRGYEERSLFLLCIGKPSYLEAHMQPRGRIRLAPAVATLVLLGICGGCRQKPPPVATPADVASAQQEAQREVDRAKVEAKKDVKSATKIMGADSKEVARARITGAFDIAMARADGDHKVAIEKCMTLEPP